MVKQVSVTPIRVATGARSMSSFDGIYSFEVSRCASGKKLYGRVINITSKVAHGDRPSVAPIVICDRVTSSAIPPKQKQLTARLCAQDGSTCGHDSNREADKRTHKSALSAKGRYDGLSNNTGMMSSAHSSCTASANPGRKKNSGWLVSVG